MRITFSGKNDFVNASDIEALMDETMDGADYTFLRDSATQEVHNTVVQSSVHTSGTPDLDTLGQRFADALLKRINAEQEGSLVAKNPEVSVYRNVRDDVANFHIDDLDQDDLDIVELMTTSGMHIVEPANG